MVGETLRRRGEKSVARSEAVLGEWCVPGRGGRGASDRERGVEDLGCH